MDPLVAAAATAVVTAMATDGWQAARRAMVQLWRRVHPEQLSTIESELDDTRAEIATACQAGDAPANEHLIGFWQLKLQRLLNSSPEIEAELRQVLDEVLIPLLPADEQNRIGNVQNVIATAPGATAQGAMFGNVINYGAPPTTQTASSPDWLQAQTDPQ